MKNSHGIDAVRGRWVGDRTFEVERRILGHGETERWLLQFEGDSLEATYENTDGLKGKVHGQALAADGERH